MKITDSFADNSWKIRFEGANEEFPVSSSDIKVIQALRQSMSSIMSLQGTERNSTVIATG
jgi:hypothetical protein